MTANRRIAGVQALCVNMGLQDSIMCMIDGSMFMCDALCPRENDERIRDEKEAQIMGQLA